MLQPDPRIIAVKLLHKSGRTFFRAAVRQTKFKLPVALCRNGLQKLPQILLRRIIKRDHDTDERFIIKCSFTLPVKFPCRRSFLFQPPLVLFFVCKIIVLYMIQKTCDPAFFQNLFILCQSSPADGFFQSSGFRALEIKFFHGDLIAFLDKRIFHMKNQLFSLKFRSRTRENKTTFRVFRHHAFQTQIFRHIGTNGAIQHARNLIPILVGN